MTGAELKQRALSYGIKQAELARRIGVPVQNIDSAFRAKDATISFAMKVADALEVPLYKLLGINYRDGKNIQEDVLLINHKIDQIEALSKELKGLLKG